MTAFFRAVPLAFIGAATAASLFTPSRRTDATSPLPSSVVVNFTNVVDPYSFDIVDLFGDDQVIYTANITVDGQSYEVSTHYSHKNDPNVAQVQLDTGSSDFWLNTQNYTLSPQANDTNISVSIVYGYA